MDIPRFQNLRPPDLHTFGRHEYLPDWQSLSTHGRSFICVDLPELLRDPLFYRLYDMISFFFRSLKARSGIPLGYHIQLYWIWEKNQTSIDLTVFSNSISTLLFEYYIDFSNFNKTSKTELNLYFCFSATFHYQKPLFRPINNRTNIKYY